MRKLCLTLLIVCLSAFIPHALEAQVFKLLSTEKTGGFYFTPAASSKEYAVFGYMSKIVPTPEEIEDEKRRIRAIIDESVRRGYGSWENFENTMREAGEKGAEKLEKEAPPWVRSLISPSLVREAVPLLMKGALLYAKRYPEKTRQPVGNVGETGVVVVNKDGGITKIPLGINEPVVSIDISLDGRLAAVLTDLSFEDKNGSLHLLGEISLIDLYSKKRIRSWIFANLAERVAFVPQTQFLAFDCHTDVKNLSKREVRLLDLRSGQPTKHHFPFISPGSGVLRGKNITYPGFLVFIYRDSSRGAHNPAIALYAEGAYEIRDLFTGEDLFKVRSSGRFLALAHNPPWLFTDLGELWDYEAGRLLASIKPRLKGMLLPLTNAQFIENDSHLLYLEGDFLTLFDTHAYQEVARSEGVENSAGIFFLTPDDRFLISFIEGKRKISYQGRYLKRSPVCLRIISTQNLKAYQNICIEDSTVIDAAMAGNLLVVSDYDRLHLYMYTEAFASPGPLTAEQSSSILAKIAKDPAKYADRIIEVKGWAWGWMAKPPRKEFSSLPLARNNYGSRSDGTFTDGVVCVLYPVPLKFSGPFHLKAKVILKPWGWQLMPVN